MPRSPPLNGQKNSLCYLPRVCTDINLFGLQALITLSCAPLDPFQGQQNVIGHPVFQAPKACSVTFCCGPAAATPAWPQLNPASLRCHPNAELWHEETSAHAATGSIISETRGPICKTRGQQPFVSAWFVHIPFPLPPALFGLPPIRLLTDSRCSMLGRSTERGS